MQTPLTIIKSKMKKIALLLTTILLIVGCQKDDIIPKIEESPFLTDAGNDFLNINEFKVSLNANEITGSEKGTWTIISGLVDFKVYFEDKNNPKTIFNGLPGEDYKLVWTVTNFGKIATDTTMVSFSPLQTEIINISPEFYKTRLWLQAKSYDKGLWTIDEDYHHIWNQNFGGTVIPDIESPHIKFYGYENKNYGLTWTTWYGSKSASVTINFNSSVYQQDEALEDLGVLNSPFRFEKNDNGDVIMLNMGGDGSGWIIGSLENYPAMKSLIHLKKLDLSGDGFNHFPEVIASNYLDLEFLDFGHNAISNLPENFGNLQKLDTLIIEYNNNDEKLTALPESFGQLKNLRYLKMASMGITSLPDSFGDLTKLNYLDLTNNVISNLPDSFGNLSNLETIARLEINEILPLTFSNLSKLKKCILYIYSDNATSLPNDFGRLINLEELILGATLERFPDNFSNLINLKKLEIFGIFEELPLNFGDLINLEVLRIQGEFTTLPSSFTNLTNLFYLRLHGKLDYLPNDFGDLKKLSHLRLNTLNLKELPDSFGDLDSLYYFSAYWNEITIIPDSFGNLKSLYELDLSYNSISSFPNTMSNLSGILYKVRIRGNNYSEEELNHLKEMLPLANIVTD